jgi:hypothetical protein
MRLAGAALVLGTIVAVLVWVVPPSLDWDAWRGAIARFASAELGRPVEIDGRVAVSLLPSPVVIAERVRLGDRGDGISMTAPALRLDVAFAPLLLGRIAPRGLVLSGATITVPWPLPAAALDRRRFAGVRSARLDDARIVAGGLVLTGVDAALTENAAAPGALAVSGRAATLGQDWLFAIRLDAPDALGDVPLDARVEALAPRGGAGAPDIGGIAQGLLRHDGAVDLHLRAHAADLGALIRAPALRAGVQGTLHLGAGPAEGALQVDLAGSPVAITLGAGRGGAQSIGLNAAELDLNPWIATLRQRPGRRKWPVAGPPIALEVSVAAGALRVGAAVIGDARAVVALDRSGRGTVRAASALLPGQAAVSVSGVISQAPRLSFTGPVRLDAPQLRRTLDWLAQCGVRIGARMPDGVLRSARLEGQLTATRLDVALDRMSGTIDASRVAGGIAIDPASGAIDATLRTDALAFDDWVGPGAWPGWDAVSRDIAPLALALRLQAGRVTFRGRAFAGVALDAATEGGGVSVNGLDATLDGMRLHAAGTIGADGTVAGGTLDLSAEHAGALAAQLPAGLRFTDQLWSGPVRLHLDATGPKAALLASLALDLDGARLEAHPTIDLESGAWSTQLTLRHPGAARLLEDMGWGGAGTWLGEGSLSVLAQVSGTPDAVRIGSYDLTAGDFHAGGDATLTLPRLGTPVLTGHLNADTLPLPAVGARERTPLPLGWMRGMNGAIALSVNSVSAGDSALLTHVQGAATLDDGVATLSIGQATLGGGTLGGSATLDTTRAPAALAVRADIAGAALAGPLFGTRIDLAGGTYQASLDLTAQGDSPDTLLGSLGGTVVATVTGGTLGGMDLSAAPDDTVGSGGTAFSALHATATVTAGIVRIRQADVTTGAGTDTLSGLIDLPDGQVDLLATLPGGQPRRVAGEM